MLKLNKHTLKSHGNLESSCNWGFQNFSLLKSMFVPNLIVLKFFFLILCPLLGVCELFLRLVALY